jgi:hypothetical protein
MKPIKQRGLSNESYIILVICTFDLVATIWLVATNRAIEGNPVMSFYLDQGWDALIGVKLLLVIFPLFIAEWGRRYRPKFVRRMLRLAIAVYVGVYALAFTNIDIMASAMRLTDHKVDNQAATTYAKPPVPDAVED